MPKIERNQASEQRSRGLDYKIHGTVGGQGDPNIHDTAIVNEE
jgi:hypothetical protein